MASIRTRLAFFDGVSDEHRDAFVETGKPREN